MPEATPASRRRSLRVATVMWLRIRGTHSLLHAESQPGARRILRLSIGNTGFTLSPSPASITSS
jgi:hypothetical protein